MMAVNPLQAEATSGEIDRFPDNNVSQNLTSL
jgi:hypothetical protein